MLLSLKMHKLYSVRSPRKSTGRRSRWLFQQLERLEVRRLLSSTPAGYMILENAGSYQVPLNGNESFTAASVTQGSLPAGLNLSSSGLISGSPSAGTQGNYSLTVNMTPSGGSAYDQPLTLTVLPNQFVNPNPSPNDGFGSAVVVLANGNVVVAAPQDDTAGTNAGAVYLFDGKTGSVLSSLKGSTIGDQVGSGGVTVLTNGNYVVDSPNWHNTAGFMVGAVSWCNGTSGLNGTISFDNSLIGTSFNGDSSVGGVTALTNGNYVVASPYWSNGTKWGVGAVTWCSGLGGTTGAVSTSNSLIGGNITFQQDFPYTMGDQIGLDGVVALSNGNYVILSSHYKAGCGAVTWCNGNTGLTGELSLANSLLGTMHASNPGWSFAGADLVGSKGIVELANGNYVVNSPCWGYKGAVTWGSGTAGVTGYVSSDNSLIGSSGGYDSGFGGPFITVLPSGNYVVRGPIWHDESLDYVGAVTWGSGTAGVTGYVSSVNSLVGCQDLDYVGDDGVTVLGNGNYVVVSSYWSNGTMYNAGAVTWGSGTAGVKGVVSSSNSLIGSSADDRIGSGGVTALSNGNYLTFSPSWDNGTIADVGALTWSSGMVGVTGAVSSDNSLVGSASDSVGRGSIKPLSNGNYVVCDPYWGDGRGAATWCNGTTALTGEFTYANSLVGDRPNDPGIPISQDGDRVGSGGVVELANGNYVVCSPNWFLSRGAVTWGSGTAGVTGVVSMDNSLVGNSGGYNWYTTVGDFVGDIVKPLSNGNFLVWTSHYKNGTVANAGAVTLGDGIGGVTGAISGLNSLIGPFTTDPIVNEASNSYFIGLQSPEVIATGTLGDRLTTTVISSANPSFYGNLVNFTALVPTGATGTVTFMDGNSTLGTGIISNGIATLSAVALGVGKHSIVAEYGGDNAHPSSTSMSMVQSVNRAWVPPTLTSSPNPSVAATLVTFTAKVPMDATGTVTFKSDNVVLGTSTISNGIATFSTASLSRGDHAIIVNYQGDSNYQPSMSKSFTQSVILSNVAGLATFLQEDRNTEGTWKPLYGADGFDLSQDQSKNNPSLPAYAGLAFANAQGYTWNSSTTNPRALQKPPLGSPDRIAATWYSASKFSFDVYLNQAQTHQITLYALDWDLGGRSELIQVFDTAKGTLLDSHSLDGFSHGVYLSWNIQGNVTFVVSNLTNSPNAVLSALFFGGAPQASGQATFVSTNSTTQGTWTEKYGAEGFDVSQDPSAVNPSFPSYASVNFANASNAVWSRTTSEVRALQKANIGQGGRIAGTWFSGDSFSINIKVNDG